LFGTSASLYIGAFLLVSESIDSPRWITRWWYRYCIFSLWFSIALPLTIAALGAFVPPSIWLVIAAIAALGLYFLNRRISLYFDSKKVAARKALAAKWRSRAGR
jgi:hypothetical protein